MNFMPLIETAASLALTVAVFAGAVWLNRKTKSPLLNPLLVSVAVIMALITLCGIPLESYESGTRIIASMLGPATAVLAFSIYQQRKILKSNFLPIFSGCLVGSIVSMISAYALCTFFGLGEEVALSTLPKSTTAPIALSITDELGGTASITMAAVMTTGVLGAIFSPMLANVFRIKNKVAQGVAIGTCSHAIGTAKALEMGKLEGAMSGVAIAVSGLLTCFIVIAAQALG
ncbi:MAG: LrgB family protein [Slackia sp.]|nr:LrgB family protein [Slackia sp.]